MGISNKNSEGYADPTPFEAVKQMEKDIFAFRPIVYICSPYAGDIEGNVNNARRYSRVAVDMGYLPVAPHLLFPQFLNDNSLKERQLGMFFGNVLMSKCAEVWVCGETVSIGMKEEIERARSKHYKLRFFDKEMKEVPSYA